MTRKLKLTRMVGLHGCSCKLPFQDLYRMLDSVGLILFSENGKVLLGPGDDAGAIKVEEHLAYVAHLDFITPLTDDPHEYGSIAACNAASDIFAKGAVDNLGVLAIIGMPLDISKTTTYQILRGLVDFCHSVDARILGGHTIINPWPIVGAAVTATITPSQLIRNSTCKPRDILVLTKPLGTQPAMAVMRVGSSVKKKLADILSHEKIEAAVRFAKDSMLKPNRDAALVMQNVVVNAATDVSGFGLLLQAQLMAERSGVDIEINSLPVIEGTPELSEFFGYGLHEGKANETSGGLLISLPRGKAKRLIRELRGRGYTPHIIGGVTGKGGRATLSDKCRIVEVSPSVEVLHRVR